MRGGAFGEAYILEYKIRRHKVRVALSDNNKATAAPENSLTFLQGDGEASGF